MQMMPFTMPLSTSLIKALLRHLNSNAFAAKALLIQAIAGFTGEAAASLVPPFIQHHLRLSRSPRYNCLHWVKYRALSGAVVEAFRT